MTGSKRIIHTTEAPSPIGPYSQAVAAGDFIFLSGQIAIDPKTSKMIEGNASEQTRQIMENLKAVLAAANSDFGHVAKATIFVTDMGDFHAVNEVYKNYFDASTSPARAVLQVAALPAGANVEIEMVAQK